MVQHFHQNIAKNDRNFSLSNILVTFSLRTGNLILGGDERNFLT